jgi:hypothetical protein
MFEENNPQYYHHHHHQLQLNDRRSSTYSNINLEKRILLIKKYNKEIENPISKKKSIFCLPTFIQNTKISIPSNRSISSCSVINNNNNNNQLSKPTKQTTQSFKINSNYKQNFTKKNKIFNNIFVSYIYNNNKKNYHYNIAKLIKVSSIIENENISSRKYSKSSYTWSVDAKFDYYTNTIKRRRASSLPQVIVYLF